MATIGISEAMASSAPERAADEMWLREEAVRFGRYLIGAPPSAELVDRYARAHAHVGGLRESPTPGDEAVLAFLRAHPWSLPLLDGGTALVGGAPLLRRKLLVMTAILETTPEHAEATLPAEGVSLPRLALRLGRAGVTAAVKLGAGAVLAAAVTWRARGARGGG
jgi:hypothetical protein